MSSAFARTGRAALALGLAATLAPGCSFGNPFGFEIPDVGSFDASLPQGLPDDAVAIDADQQAAIVQCGSDDDTDEAHIVAASATLADRSDGSVDVPFSVHGCLHFTRELAAGRLVRASIYRFTGAVFLYRDETGHYMMAARRTMLATWQASGDTVTGNIDQDGDWRDTTDRDFEVQTIERSGYYQVTQRDPASRDVVWRLTDDESTTTQTLERTGDDGTLATFEQSSITLESLQCGEIPVNTSACVTQAMPCDAATSERYEGMLTQAVALANGRLTTSHWQALQGLKLLWGDQHEWSCMAGEACTFAMWCGVTCPDQGARRIYVGAPVARAPEEEQIAMLLHEMLHGIMGIHPSVARPRSLPHSERNDLIRTYVDPVLACESFITDPRPTRCACATCLNLRTCDQPCSHYASCVQRDATGMAIMSEAVGTACITHDECGEELATWYPTVATCQMSGCEALLPGTTTVGTCRSYMRSCDPNCE